MICRKRLKTLLLKPIESWMKALVRLEPKQGKRRPNLALWDSLSLSLSLSPVLGVAKKKPRSFFKSHQSILP